MSTGSALVATTTLGEPVAAPEHLCLRLTGFVSGERLCCCSRYDYESVATDKADAVMAHLSAHIAAFNAAKAANAAHGMSS